MPTHANPQEDGAAFAPQAMQTCVQATGCHLTVSFSARPPARHVSHKHLRPKTTSLLHVACGSIPTDWRSSLLKNTVQAAWCGTSVQPPMSEAARTHNSDIISCLRLNRRRSIAPNPQPLLPVKCAVTQCALPARPPLSHSLAARPQLHPMHLQPVSPVPRATATLLL